MKSLTLAALLLVASTAFATTTSVVTPAASAASAPKACVPSPAVTCGVKPVVKKPVAKPVATKPVSVAAPTAVIQEKVVFQEKIVIKEVPVIKTVEKIVKVPTPLPTQPNAWKLEGSYLYDNSVGASGMRIQADSPWNVVGMTPVAQYDYVPNAYQRIGLGVQYPVAKLENTQFLVTGRGFYQDTSNGSNTGGGGLGLKLNTALTPKVSFVAGTEYNWIGSGKDGALITLGLNYAF